jgi:hypothetical protein
MFTHVPPSRWACFITCLLCTIMVSCSVIKDAAMADPEKYFTDPDLIALVKAASAGDTRTIDRLVEKGVDVNTVGKDGAPLAFAGSSRKGFQRLLEHGADPNLSGNGTSVMELVAGAEDIELLRLALAHGGDPNLVAQRLGQTPIFNAIMRTDDKENIRLLIEAGADLDAQDTMGRTPMMVAANLRAYDVVNLLLEAGADYTITDNHGYALVHRLVELDNLRPDTEMYNQRSRVMSRLAARGVDFRAIEEELHELRKKRRERIREAEKKWGFRE